MSAAPSDDSTPETSDHSSPTATTGPFDCLDHIAISATDLAATVAWYREHFRCEVLAEEPGRVLLGFDNVRLALTESGRHGAHIAFRSDRAEEFGALTSRADGSRSTYLTDPSGNEVEVMSDE